MEIRKELNYMNIFSLLFGKKVDGYIRAFGLETWWNDSFTSDEQKYIVDKFQPMGGSSNMLVEGNLQPDRESKSMFLANLASWFKTKKDLDIARKMILEAEKSLSGLSYMDQHFYYTNLIEHYYLDRENPESFEASIQACENQIRISKNVKLAFMKDMQALPGHKGFIQLAIIEEKRNNYEKAIQLSEKALDEGWTGDWEKRITRLQKKDSK